MEWLGRHFLQSARRFPDRPALNLDGQTWTYQELFSQARRIAARLADQGAGPHSIGVVGHRDFGSYAGILGTLLAGKTYVPFNPKHPLDRNAIIARRLGIETFVLSRKYLDYLEQLAAINQIDSTAVLSEGGEDGSGARRHLRLVPLASDEPGVSVAGEWSASSTDLAYVLSTSGTTGTPKSIGIRNLSAFGYVNRILSSYDYNSQDRFTQMFDLTFDLSIHDMFVCWASGACLCVPDDLSVIAPWKFINEKKITCWFSVPSIAQNMQRLGVLKAGAFPSLRHTLFCGERLPASVVKLWQVAAPNSTIDNLYGPTEATISFTRYRWQGEKSESECIKGTVPIGVPFEGLSAVVVGDDDKKRPVGETGELLLAGDQLADGYLGNPEETARRFVHLEIDGELETLWYRSGDLAVWNPDGGGLTVFGREDTQVKIQGNRIDLLEIEHTLEKQLSGVPVIALAVYNSRRELYTLVVCLLEQFADRASEVEKICKDCLPPYMKPNRICLVPTFPLNSNSKVDRAALRKSLEAQNEET